MAETIEQSCVGPKKWHWGNIMNDLEVGGELPGVVIDPFSVDTHSCGGKTKKGTKFFITWAADTFLLLSMSQEEQTLIEAFAKVVEYRPFCSYINKDGFLTFEWDKKDPETRFIELQKEGKKDLRRIR